MKIKNILKTLIITIIVSMSMASMAFASDNSNYIYIYSIETNNNIVTEKYTDGSWCSFDDKGNYNFKPVKSDIKHFDNLNDLNNATVNYEKSSNKNEPLIFQNSYIVYGIGKHSNKIYTNFLKTNDDLEDYAKQWLKDNYNLTVDFPIYFTKIDNIDGKMVNGYYSYKNNKIVDIKINVDLKNYNIPVEKTLIHELSHVALFKLGKEFRDETNTFDNEVIKNGSNTNEGKIGMLHSHLKSTL